MKLLLKRLFDRAANLRREIFEGHGDTPSLGLLLDVERCIMMN
jgi:hypothetical protein